MIRAFRPAVALLALTPLLGCAGPARAPGPPGSTLILLENKVSGDCDLTWANARVDDRPLRLMTIAPPGAKPAPLDRPILTPGEHTVTIAATASCVSARSDEPSVLQVTQPIYMSKEGGAVTISIALKKGESTIEATFAVEGGHLLAPRADGGDVDCKSREPMDRAVCRTEAILARAHQNKDVALATCVSDKLREMRHLRGTLGSQLSDPTKEDPALRGVAEGVEERVVALGLEADLCIGEEMLTDSGTRIQRDSRPAPAFR